MRIAIVLVCLTLTHTFCNSGKGNNSSVSQVEDTTAFTLPEGFKAVVYAEVKNARAMTLSENGTVFIGSKSEGKIYALLDDDKDGIVDNKLVIDEGLNMPVGVSYYKGDLYVSSVDKIYKYSSIEDNLFDVKKELISDKFPDKTHHGWKFIDIGPDGKLYVPVGAPCNICEEDPDVFANIMMMDPDGSNLEVFSKGVRNTVGFAWHPETSEMWFTDNGRDWLGDELPPCELNHAPNQGLHFGYPYCHGSDVKDPKFGNKRDCSEFQKPAWNFDAHVGPLGMCFYTGNLFPEEYRNQAFVALHGSWNRSIKVGYEVVLVKFKNNSEVESVSSFFGGLLNGSKIKGRPVDVMELHDGSLLISDDFGNKIYRITYE